MESLHLRCGSLENLMLAMRRAKMALVEIVGTGEERQAPVSERCWSWSALLDDAYS